MKVPFSQFARFLQKGVGIAILLFFTGIALAAAYAPVIQYFKGYPFGENIYALFSHVCHQYPTRSFWLFDRPFALCSRCIGGYLGLGLSPLFLSLSTSSIFHSWIVTKRFWLGLSLLSFAVGDGIFQSLLIYDSSNFLRFISGFLGGFGLFLLFFPGKLGFLFCLGREKS